MATVVNKDFKIKSGLVVEGTNATVNGNQVLTETASDSYIIDLIGGETLVTSVDSTQLQVVNGELSVKSGVFDADGAADAAETAANLYTDGRETAITSAYQSYADTAEQDAKNYADGLASNYDAAGSASTAESNANTYTDNKINDASNATDKVWSAYKTSTEIGLAQSAAETFATEAIADLVDGAPGMLDTLNELAAALQDNPDVIQNIQDVAAGKQDTLTAGSNIEITGSTISVTGLDTEDVMEAPAGPLYFTNQRALDATSSAYDATGTAQSIVDALDTDDIEEGLNNLYFTDYRATQAAATLLTGATKNNIEITGDGSPTNPLVITAENGVAGSTTDDLTEGEDNLYFTNARAQDALEGTTPTFAAVDIDSVAKQVAATLSAPTAGIQVGYQFAKADYRSAEFLVKVAYGSHTEISKVLLTLDTSDNIAITEYGVVGTNGSASTISADVYGPVNDNVRLLVTTANNNSTVTVMGTLLA